MKISYMLLVFAIFVGFLLIIIFFSPLLMDILLALSIVVSAFILLFSLFAKNPLKFPALPALLLITTLFRITANLFSTRLLFGSGGNLGSITRTLGSLIIGNDYMIGSLVFLIVALTSLAVITKRANYVSETATDFILDVIPTRQLTVEAGLISGVIDGAEAGKRLSDIQRALGFHSEMDGTSKFIKGDAIVTAVMTLFHIISSIIIVKMRVGSLNPDLMHAYMLSTIGNGLAAQLPALLIATAAGIIAARSSVSGLPGAATAAHISFSPLILLIMSPMLIIISFIPGMPGSRMWIISSAFLIIGILCFRWPSFLGNRASSNSNPAKAHIRRSSKSSSQSLHAPPIELELGHGGAVAAIALEKDFLLDSVSKIRHQCALDLGIIVPPILLSENDQLNSGSYSIKIKGVEAASGEIMIGHTLMFTSGEYENTIRGVPVVEPVSGLPALWIPEASKEEALRLGNTLLGSPALIAAHLTETIKKHAREFLDRHQVQALLENLAVNRPALVDKVVPELLSLAEVQKILSNLLIESVPINELATIMETLAEFAPSTRDSDLLTEHIRQALRSYISKRFIPNDVAHVITLAPALEQFISEHTRHSAGGSSLALKPQELATISTRLGAAAEKLRSIGAPPIFVTSPHVRRQFRKIAEQLSKELVVLSFSELDSGIQICSEGVLDY